MGHYATSRVVVGSIPDEVIWFLIWPNPSSRTIALRSTQPLTEMSTRKLPRAKGRPAPVAGLSVSGLSGRVGPRDTIGPRISQHSIFLLEFEGPKIFTAWGLHLTWAATGLRIWLTNSLPFVSRLSKKCWSLDIAQPNGLPQPVTEISFTFFFYNVRYGT
jgi:hypothetical protein